jgi:hypothetical protein
MNSYLLLFAVAAILAAFESAHATAPCKNPITVPDELVPTRLVIFGELHGTQEAPQFVADYICALIGSSRSAVLALEIHRKEQDALDEFVGSDGSAAAQQKLLRSGHWQISDGRSSRAMLELLQYIRTVRERGFDVKVIAFDDWPKDRNRDAAQADGIRAIYNANPDKQVVVLIGNYHAKRTGRQGQKPAAAYLDDVSFYTLNIRHPKGTIWTCSARNECGARNVMGLPSITSPTRRIELGTSMFAPGFDGQYFVSEINASPPASQGSGPPPPQ